MSEWSKARVVIDEMVNRHFESAEYRRIFGVRLTPARQAILDLHYPHYIKSRRDCWAVAAGKAPLDVKRAIWEHEKDELIFDERLGAAHLTDDDMAGATDEANLLPGARAAFWAWFHLCSTRSWIEALMVNHTTERKNNNEIVKGGGFTHRSGKPIVSGMMATSDSTKTHMEMGHDDRPPKPTWVHPHPTQPFVYVANNGIDEIVEVDLDKWEVARRFKTTGAPYNLEVTSDGRYLVASQKKGGSTGIFDLGTGEEIVRITNSRKVTHGVAIAPDNRYAFVTVEGIGGEPGSVDVIDMQTMERVATAETGKQAGGIAFWKISEN